MKEKWLSLTSWFLLHSGIGAWTHETQQELYASRAVRWDLGEHKAYGCDFLTPDTKVFPCLSFLIPQIPLLIFYFQSLSSFTMFSIWAHQKEKVALWQISETACVVECRFFFERLFKNIKESFLKHVACLPCYSWKTSCASCFSFAYRKIWLLVAIELLYTVFQTSIPFFSYFESCC